MYTHTHNHTQSHTASQVVLMVKNLPANAGDVRDAGLIPGLGRSPGAGHGNPLQYSCLETPWTEEPGGLQSMGSQRVGHDRSNLARTHTHTFQERESLACSRSQSVRITWLFLLAKM